MIPSLGRDALLVLLALVLLVYIGSLLRADPLAIRPIALLAGVVFAGLGAIGYDRVRATARERGEGDAAGVAAWEVAVALAILGLLLLGRLLTMLRPPPAHVESGLGWFVVGAAGATLLIAIGATVRRAVSN